MSKPLVKKLIIVGVIILVVGGIVLACVMGDVISGKGGPSGNDANQTLDPNQGDYVPPKDTDGESGGIAIPGWVSITIPAGETEVSVDFPNPIANADKYYLTFQLRLADTNEVLYTSGLVEPGKHIQTITLSRALDAGTYDAIILVQPYTMAEPHAKTNNADMETKLIVVD